MGLIENAMGPPSKAWTLIKEFDKEPQFSDIASKNPFADMVSVEVIDRKEFDGMSLETAGEIVELTIRVPEQFFTETYMKADWDAAMAALEAEKNLPDGEVLDREVMWALPGYLVENWLNDIDAEQELYGPSGQQVPLW